MKLALLALILILGGVNAYVYVAIFAPQVVRVTPLKVGKGDATLVTLPDGHALLINAGPDAGIVRALGDALPPWQRHLDAILLLSDAAREKGGVPFVLARYGVSSVQKMPAGSGALLLHYGSLTLPLASTTGSGVYAIK